MWHVVPRVWFTWRPVTGEGARRRQTVAKNPVPKSLADQAVQLGWCPVGRKELRMVYKQEMGEVTHLRA